MIANKKLSKSLNLFRLLVLLISLFVSLKISAVNLKIENDKIKCIENNCSISIKKNQKIEINKDKRIINLIEINKDNEEKLINFIFYTTDITKALAYSGKPLEFLISLNQNGDIEDLKLIKHSEPILLTGIPIEKLLEATAFYKGKNINNKINIGEDSSKDVGIPIIAGATVTSLILHETILGSTRRVARICGILNDIDLDEGGLNKKFKNLSWQELLNKKAIKRYKLDSLFNENEKADKNNLLLDIYIADLKHPSIGKNLLGETEYNELIKELGDNKSAIIILNNGNWSFKGSGFVRGGIFDRFQIKQNSNVFIFKDSDFRNVYDLELIDIDEFRESGIFLISNKKYKPHKPWNLTLLLNYKLHDIEYKIPKEFCISEVSAWKKIWNSKSYPITLYLFLWLSTILIFIFRYKIAKNNFYLPVIYNCILVFDIYIMGILFEGQPSIVNIFTLISVKKIEVFILDPCIFLGWIMIISTIFIWGKSLFCGWICPFGAIQELFFKIRSMIIQNDKSVEFSEKITNKLKYLRYIIFTILIIISFKSFKTAEILAEVEPFKTMWIIGISNRSIIPAFYTILLLIISLFTYRFFCRFMCPLGAFLSILSFFTIFKLKRRGTCVACHICEKSCNSKAIDKNGNIDSKECFGCFTCVNNMYNKNLCPPIKNEKVRKKYEKKWWI